MKLTVSLDALNNKHDMNDTTFSKRIECFHHILEEWLADPDVTVACGRWNDGAIAEMVTHPEVTLLPAIYHDCFSGVRELRFGSCGHHIHIDLGRVHTLLYTIAPSVCFDFRPSFELRFMNFGPGGMESNQWILSIMLSQPYSEQGLDRASASRYFAKAARHFKEFPAWVNMHVDKRILNDSLSLDILSCLQNSLDEPISDWDAALDYFQRKSSRSANEIMDPIILPVLKDALNLKEASLVVYRERLLVEFQTEKIPGVFRYLEDGHVSWQIGHLKDHHCHLALHSVTSVLFSAEPTSCQQGRLNYTLWFNVDGDCGNPWQRNGYFSIVLNRPYHRENPRLDIIQPIFDLYRKYSPMPWVSANNAFMDSLQEYSRKNFLSIIE